MDERESRRARVNPEDFVRYHLKRKHVAPEDAGVGRALVMTWVDGVKAFEGAEWPTAPVGLYGVRTRDGVSAVKAPVGAPATVMVMEEMIALGVKAFLGIGLCGSLDERYPLGSLVVAGRTHRDEGTSYHYAVPAFTPEPTERALKALREAGAEDVPVVDHWSTDSIYRETLGKIERRRGSNIRTVDMEASAVYTLAHYRKVEAAMLLVVTDELWHEWHPGFFDPLVLQGKARALEIGEKAARILSAMVRSSL